MSSTNMAALDLFFRKHRVFLPDERYAAFSIYRYHERMARKLESALANVGQLKRVLVAKQRELETLSFDHVTEEANPFDTKLRLVDEIKALETKIRRIETKEEQNEYFGNSCKFLTDYCTTRASLNAFERSLENHSLLPQVARQADKMRRAYEARLTNITEEYLRTFFPDEATRETPRQVATPEVNEDVLSCFNWGYDQIHSCVSPERHYNYKRINHFREYLKQQQGESRIFVAPELLVDIQAEIRKHYVDPEAVGYSLVKHILKRTESLNKYHEHAKYITRLLNKSYRPLAIAAEHECTLCQRFAETEAPFEKFKTAVVSTRKNFMSYPFVAYKLCELQGYDQYLPSFKLLKSVRLLTLQDTWWALICKELNWQFIRTVGRDAAGENKI